MPITQLALVLIDKKYRLVKIVIFLLGLGWHFHQNAPFLKCSDFTPEY